MYVNRERADKYQGFFNFMNREHDLILTILEMDEIISEAQKLIKNWDVEKCTNCNGTGEVNQGIKPDGGYYMEDYYKCVGTGRIEVDK